MSYQPNSYALFESSNNKKYFSEASYEPNSYELFNSNRKSSGGRKSRRHKARTSRKKTKKKSGMGYATLKNKFKNKNKK